MAASGDDSMIGKGWTFFGVGRWFGMGRKSVGGRLQDVIVT
jgi:hypothetical protein